MVFSFDIDMDEYDLGSPEDFKRVVIEAAVQRMVSEMWYWDGEKVSETEIKNYTRKYCREHETDIFNEVVTRIVKNIEKKKSVKELAPTAKDIQIINKENEHYLLELIDKAIAKRFK